MEYGGKSTPFSHKGVTVQIGRGDSWSVEERALPLFIMELLLRLVEEIVGVWRTYSYPGGQPLLPRPHWAKDIPPGLEILIKYLKIKAF